ncbi:MAG: polysaccharide biosynthesis protein, partial [Proteobacteria bacterium]|nr:polysaccharide biosynthesis protein [Pseudomonadota bacterium]
MDKIRRLLNFTPRMWLIFAHDLIATAAAIVAAFYLRFEGPGLAERAHVLPIILPAVVTIAAIVYLTLDLYKSKWRFTSLLDLRDIVRAASVMAFTLLALDYVMLSPNLYGGFFFGKLTIILYWFLQGVFLAGPRVTYRYFRYTRTLQHARAEDAEAILVLGNAADADVLLRAVESGAVRRLRALGILSPSRSDRGQAIRGVAVLGDFSDLERLVADFGERGAKIRRLVMTPSALAPGAHPESILMRARRLGLVTSRLPSLDEGGEALRLAPVHVEDLLLRPSVKIGYRRIEEFVRGRAILVTGGGGSIGAEICDRVVAYGAARLLVVENCEPALHTVLESLRTKGAGARVDGRIADIRDRERISKLTLEFAPDIVFHAAALKHVPFLERDWSEGVKTNIFGSVNVADAAVAAGAAMVMISTDKAIEPVSVLGATKRFAEMYCQALDANIARGKEGKAAQTRLIAVRFGNVLASNGSVVPKFKAQIESGGPVTVTHPDMVRYFMTIREACDLVITAASHALGPQRSELCVYVLNMGQPVRIVELAENMIRLSGLEPGRDVKICFTGIRPGERLNEILFSPEEPISEIGIEGIVATEPVRLELATMREWLARLEFALAQGSRADVDMVLRSAVPDFHAAEGAIGERLARNPEHDPEKWEPVFG